jgi:hypothetical protein
MDSNPTPRAKLVDSTTSLKYQNKQKNNRQLKVASSSVISTPTQGQIVKDELKEKIISICKYQKNYVQKLLKTLSEKD